MDVVGVVTPLFAEVRRFCMAIRLSSSVCCSKCMRRKKRERMVKDRSKLRVREVNLRRDAHVHG